MSHPLKQTIPSWRFKACMARLLGVRCRDIYLKGGLPTIWAARLSDFVPIQRTLPRSSVFDTDVGESLPDPAQRENAEELLLLPFDVLPVVADGLEETQLAVKNICLYNTGRCGSTLMCKALDVISEVQAVSEPDVFQVIIERVCKKDVPLSSDERNEIIKLLKCSVILINFYFQQKDPSRKVICYKFRSDAIFIADLIQKAAPMAKTIFIQQGSVMQSGRRQGNSGRSWVGTWEKNLFSTTLEHFNGDVNVPDFVLPNTVIMD
ncbi:hypothetical protein Bbelb_422430 [Branchiostoma belcheri]|nr:hypothetical protein Bbelb_422430 [Branchiostoma belcheri]